MTYSWPVVVAQAANSATTGPIPPHPANCRRLATVLISKHSRRAQNVLLRRAIFPMEKQRNNYVPSSPANPKYIPGA